jgi:hypothetical protein
MTRRYAWPWPEPANIYSDAGPPVPLEFAVGGARVLVTPTDKSAIHSGRRRYRVECLTCARLLHEATTGPGPTLEHHLEEKHAAPPFVPHLSNLDEVYTGMRSKEAATTERELAADLPRFPDGEPTAFGKWMEEQLARPREPAPPDKEEVRLVELPQPLNWVNVANVLTEADSLHKRLADMNAKVQQLAAWLVKCFPEHEATWIAKFLELGLLPENGK